MEELIFDLAPIEIPVKMGDKRYNLREASEDAACKYRNALLKSARMSGTEAGVRVTGVEGMADAEPLLVSLCLCEVDKDGATKLDKRGLPVTVPLSAVLSLNSRAVKRLFAKIQEISDLDEKPRTKQPATEESANGAEMSDVKNSSSAMTDTSA